MIDARTLARALGGEVAGRDAVLAPGPGHSPKDRSLSVRLDPNAPDGFLIFSHAGDDWRSCKDHVRKRLGLPDWQPGDEQRRTVPPSRIERWDMAAVEAEAKEGPRAWSEDEIARINYANAIWREAVDPRGTPAETYLRQHRKLDLPDHVAGNVLRFHPRCPWRNENTGRTDQVPALIAAFRSIDDDVITGIQRVRLNPDGGKHGRRMLGVVQRAAVKLDSATDELCVGEGTETALAGRQFGFRPAWALGSVGAISFFPVLDDVKRLIIFAEAGQASARAIKICGQRWRKIGRHVQIVRPNVGSDLNDAIMLRGAR
jgi:putative DNA primase/helicase